MEKANGRLHNSRGCSGVYFPMPQKLRTNLTRFFLTLLLAGLLSRLDAQMVTGVWRGKISNDKVEVKIVQKGDSLTGTSYYYTAGGRYRRYSIKGYFDQQTNSVVWWDDQLIRDNGGSSSKGGLLSVADFNCPGGGTMHLDGKSGPRGNEDPKGGVNLTKVPGTSFHDEWDFVIDNYTVGANDPEIIDSVGLIALRPRSNPAPVAEPVRPAPEPALVIETVPVPATPPSRPLTIEEQFITRKKVFVTEIPAEGDSVELRFYDNVQVDGDSISLFLNKKMIFTHIRLTEKAYVVKLAVKELEQSNELIMVAENLGSVPPNTSYMVAISGGKRYEVNLESTEGTSAMIRLRKP
ncbi:MAG TPA: hypothetical protein VFR58_14130 [Flavisolibacter sp.]|nr:hypothetical protein [Flavisolibacter sp.]